VSHNILAHLFITQEHEKTINTDNKTLATDGFGLLRVAVAHTQNILAHLFITQAHEKTINTNNKTFGTLIYYARTRKNN